MRGVYGNRGFCNINNMAIMVEYLRTAYGHRRIAIVDTDVHHGDGTQDIFWNDPDVLFISFHQDGRTLYPGSGFMEEAGGPNVLGTTINIPLPPGTPDEGIHFVLDELVLPILDDFTPELVLNSAGQDNHFSDPLANMRFSLRVMPVSTRRTTGPLCPRGGYAVGGSALCQHRHNPASGRSRLQPRYRTWLGAGPVRIGTSDEAGPGE